MDIEEIRRKHKMWILGEDSGERANLCNANLCNADLRGAKNVDKSIWSIYTAFYPLQCPEGGGVHRVEKKEVKLLS